MSLDIKAPTEWAPPEPDKYNGLFLAGGITGTADWQAEVAGNLVYENLVILNPRQADFDVNNPEAAGIQIEWEYRHMARARNILFWFPPETLCPITLFEYGKWLVSNKRLFVGVHPKYARRYDVFKQTGLERPSQLIVDTLDQLIYAVRSTAWY